MTDRSTPLARPSRARAIGTIAVVVGALAFLHIIGSGDLAAPPFTDPGALGDWLADRDPVSATFALLRLVGIGAGWYLVGATSLQVVSAVTRFGGLAGLADLVSIPAVKHVASGLLGLTITAVVGETEEASPPAATLERIADPAGSAILRRLPDGEIMVELSTTDADDEAVLRRLPDDAPADDPPTDSRVNDSWTTERGDHPWSISEEVLADAWGRAPTDDEVTPYWRDLLERNRLPNPDLIFPGQTIALPPVPPPPG